MTHLIKTFAKVTQQNDTEKENFHQNDTWHNSACKYVTPCKEIHQIYTTK
jgi:hypothetical protein